MANRNAHSGTQFSDGLIVGGDFHADSNIYLNDATSGGGPNGEDQGNIYLGTDSDLRITTSSGSGVIRQTTASKDMFIQTADNQSIRITDTGANENIATFTDNAGVKLFNDGSLKFQTTSTGASIADNLLIGPATDGVNVSTALGDLGAAVSVTTSNVTAGKTYMITTVGSKSDWSQIGGPAVAAVGSIFTTSSSHMAIATVDAGKTGTNTLTQGIDGASATSQIAELTAFPSDCKVKELPQAKLEFAAHTNDDAYIRTIRAATSPEGAATKMQFHLLDDLHSALPTLNNSINLTNFNKEIFEFTASKSGVRRDFTVLSIVPIYSGNKNEGSELILGGTSKVTATYFKGTAEKVAAFTGLDTDDLSEGTKKFFDTALVDSHLSVTTASASGGGALSYSSGTFTYTPPGKASDSALGLAKFSTDNFSVDSNGNVTIKDNGIASAEIANDAVTFAKIQDVATNTIMGRTADGVGPAKAMSATEVRGILSVAANADNYGSWNLRANDNAGVAGNNTAIGTGEVVAFQGSDATSVTRDGNTITITSTDTNTTYSADTNFGMTLNGSAFRLKNDRRRQVNNEDVYDGNLHEYIHYDNHNGADPGIMRFYVNNSERARLEADGDFHVDGDITAFSTTVSSDIKLKDNVVVVNGALEKVSQLDGVTFNWKRNGKSSAGVIAQNLEEVVPELVSEATGLNETEAHKVVDYNGLSALFIEAIKELKDQNELLKAEIEELKANK